MAYAVVMEELSRAYASIAGQCGLVEQVAKITQIYEGTNRIQRNIIARHLLDECISFSEPDLTAIPLS